MALIPPYTVPPIECGEVVNGIAHRHSAGRSVHCTGSLGVEPSGLPPWKAGVLPGSLAAAAVGRALHCYRGLMTSASAVSASLIIVLICSELGFTTLLVERGRSRSWRATEHDHRDRILNAPSRTLSPRRPLSKRTPIDCAHDASRDSAASTTVDILIGISERALNPGRSR